MSIEISQSPTVRPSTRIEYIRTGFTCVGTGNTDIEYTLKYPGFQPTLVEVEANISIHISSAGYYAADHAQVTLQVSTDGGSTFTTLDGAKIAASYNVSGNNVAIAGGIALTLRGPIQANIGDTVIIRIASDTSAGTVCIGSVRIIYHA